MSSLSKSSIITDMSRFTLTTILLSNAAEGVVKTGPLSLRRESTFDVDILLSIITVCDCLLDFLGREQLGKWACLSRLPSPLCNGELFTWRTASRAQAIEAERGLLWFSVVLEDKNVNSLWRSPLIMYHSVHCWAPTEDTDLRKEGDRAFSYTSSTWLIRCITLRLLVISSNILPATCSFHIPF